MMAPEADGSPQRLAPTSKWRRERVPHDDPDPMTAWQRGPLRLVVGRDVPWPDGKKR